MVHTSMLSTSSESSPNIENFKPNLSSTWKMSAGWIHPKHAILCLEEQRTQQPDMNETLVNVLLY